jgi:ribonuclease G
MITSCTTPFSTMATRVSGGVTLIRISSLIESKELEQKGSENIEHYLIENQHIIVQVTKDPIGSKGARLTTEISIPSRYQVYMPYAIKGGVSQRIEHEPESI